MTQPAPPDQPAYAPAPEYREPVSRVNLAAVVVAVVAAVLGVLAVTTLGWYRDDYGSVSSTSSNSTFRDVHDLLHSADGTPSLSFGIAPVYFAWLGYVLIGLAVLGALAWALTTARILRTLTALLALVGLGLTLWAIDLFSFETPPRRYVDGAPQTGYFDWLKHTGVGAWAMLAAFVLCLVAALLRPRRQLSRGY